MVHAKTRGILLAGIAACTAFSGTIVHAQDQAGDPGQGQDAFGLEEIVVTAQRRSQSINSVGMAVTALSADDLLQKQIASPADLTRLVPGFTAQETPYSTPVYTLRGIGFYDSSLAAAPSVSVYTDEVPLPYSAMTKGTAFDLQRVEVLKGPQGTLFGQNATGGAINYIAAKPTSEMTAGLDVSYGRFDTLETQGFLSGALTPTLNARVAARVVRSGDWQKSYTRDDGLGEKDLKQGRILLNWQPSERLTVDVNLNGWSDRGDTLAGQLTALDLQVPAAAPPTLASYPLAPANARAADWTPRPLHRHDDFWQSSLRVGYDLSDTLRLHSITAYSSLETRSQADTDGVALVNFDADILPSHINSLSQELRLTGDTDRLNWTLGANYARDRSFDIQAVNYPNATNNTIIPGVIDFSYSHNYGRQRVNTYAAFGNVEYELSDSVSALAGVRYTDIKRAFQGCQTPGGNAQSASSLTNLANLFFRLPIGLPALPTFDLDACSTLDGLGPNGDGVGASFTPLEIDDTLKEDNLSWRVGLNWTPAQGTLLYANVSKGYKGGGYPTLGSVLNVQYLPVVQEELLAYEVGTKLSLLDRRMQLNGSAFYYDYADKQIRAKVQVPVFNLVEGIVNIPKSRVYGAEAELMLAPVDGLVLTGAVSYLDTKIQRFTGFNQSGAQQAFDGSRLPFAPKWSVNADASYKWSVTEELGAFVGAALAYNSSTNASIGYPALYGIPDFTTLDLRAGINDPFDSWTVTVWGRNITDKYYWNNVAKVNDTVIKYAAMPATYGVSFSYRF